MSIRANIVIFFRCRPRVNMVPLQKINFRRVVIEQEPGVRVILLFVNDECKMRLIKLFAKAVVPFSR